MVASTDRAAPAAPKRTAAQIWKERKNPSDSHDIDILDHNGVGVTLDPNCVEATTETNRNTTPTATISRQCRHGGCLSGAPPDWSTPSMAGTIAICDRTLDRKRSLLTVQKSSPTSAATAAASGKV